MVPLVYGMQCCEMGRIEEDEPSFAAAQVQVECPFLVFEKTDFEEQPF
jgi:hypothetical protein